MCVLRVYLYNLFELCKTELGVKLYAFAEKKVNFIVMSVIGIEVKPKRLICIQNHTFPHITQCPALPSTFVIFDFKPRGKIEVL